MASEPNTKRPGMRRRPRGSGGLRALGDGYWEATLDLGYIDGRRDRRTFRGQTAAEAVARRHAAELAIARGEPVITARLKVRPYLERWLDTTIRSAVLLENLKPQTEVNYRNIVSAYLTPTIGEKELTALRVSDVNAMTARMKEADLSQNTIRLARSVLRRALRDAVTEGLVVRNVVMGSNRPAVAGSLKERPTLTLEQVKDLLARSIDEPLGPFVGLAIWTAMREGELLALRWQDIDFAAQRIEVNATMHRLPGKGLVTGAPKTKASKAAIPLLEPAIEVLGRQMARQEELRSRAGECWVDSGLVFTTRSGRPLDGRAVLRRWHRLREKLGVQNMTIHDLRHTTGTLLLNHGVPLEVVSAILRHSSIRITADIYAQVGIELKRTGLEQFEWALHDVVET